MADVWPNSQDSGPASFFVFQGRDYLDAWRATIGQARGTTPLFIRIDDFSGSPLMLVPLGLERRHGLRVLSFLDGGVADYNAPVLFPGAGCLERPAFADLWRRIVHTLPPFDITSFDKIPPAVGEVANPFRFLAPKRCPYSGHFALLTGDWAAFSATRLPRVKEHRRKRRRLAEHGDVRFVIAETAQERERALEAMIRQKSRRYLETRGVDGLNRAGYRSYFDTLTRRFAGTGEVHLSTLELDGVILAAHWGLISRDRFYCSMLSYEDHPLARYSPASLLIEDLIAWCYAAGVTIFDLGYGEAAWKDRLCEAVLPLSRGSQGHSIQGRAYIAAANLKGQLKSLGSVAEQPVPLAD